MHLYLRSGVGFCTPFFAADDEADGGAVAVAGMTGRAGWIRVSVRNAKDWLMLERGRGWVGCMPIEFPRSCLSVVSKEGGKWSVGDRVT